MNKFTIHVDKTVMMNVTNKKNENNINNVQMSGREVILVTIVHFWASKLIITLILHIILVI